MNTQLLLTCAAILMSLAILIILIVILVSRKGINASEMENLLDDNISAFADRMSESMDRFADNSRKNSESMGALIHRTQEDAGRSHDRQLEQMRLSLTDSQQQFQTSVLQQIEQLRTSVQDQLKTIDNRMENMRRSNDTAMESMRRSMNESMVQLRADNEKKLDEIRGTVDEKLQSTLEKRISESFRTVSDQLEKVNRGLGEMQTLADDVGSLKKVLSGVKTRGILGENSLRAILEEILSPEQYETDIATIPGSRDKVEFAIRLPGNDGAPVYLPIDSKFPGDRYQSLLDAMETGDKNSIKAARKELNSTILSEAKDIATKYIKPPYTTTFGIMFLPFEGLYAEVIAHELPERLQREFNITIAGPSTMAALLNSLQMGFRTLAIQKHSHEIYEVLQGVQSEFGKFGGVMNKMQQHLRQTSDDLDSLIGTRTNAIRRQLDRVQKLDAPEPVNSHLLPGAREN